MAEIKFGTDGWRAIISDSFTFENVRIVAQAIADYVNNEEEDVHRRKEIAVGYDTRFLSEEYARITACVLAANGIKVILSDRMSPTPSVSFCVKERGLRGGVMITASHNPPAYNGIKYKAYYAGSADPDIIGKIESYLKKNPVREESMEKACSGGAIKIENIVARHLNFAKKYINLKLLKKSKMKVLADSMYGTGNDYIASLLAGGRIRVTTIHNERNPYFGGINPEPILPNLSELAAKTKKDRFDIGIATDGDADRLGVAAENGKVLTGHKVMTLLLLHLLEDRGMRGEVVQTICGTILINKICGKYNLKMHETPVGFKYICDLMTRRDILLGGEETGGISFKGYIPERDGILSGLLILEMMAMRKKPLLGILKDIDKEYGTYEYRRIDINYPNDKKGPLMEHLKVAPPGEILGKRIVEVKSYDGFKFICEDSSWLILRFSGTEPKLRVYSEASTEKKALAILEFGKRLAYSV